jgi:hypothetical protein
LYTCNVQPLPPLKKESATPFEPSGHSALKKTPQPIGTVPAGQAALTLVTHEVAGDVGVQLVMTAGTLPASVTVLWGPAGPVAPVAPVAPDEPVAPVEPFAPVAP